jgi:AcrR family transcriptional regulator
MRADAQRNRLTLVDAARRAFVEDGPDAALEAVARRCGLGIGTLYRHFPERESLVRAVAVDVMTRTMHELETAEAEEADAFSALRRYMHRAVDVGVGSIMPLIADDTSGDREVMALRDETGSRQHRLLERAKRERDLRDDVDFADIGIAVTRFSRPVGAGFDPELEWSIAHRHLDVFIDGMRAERAATRLAGPALSLEELRAMRDPNDP